MIQEHTIHGNFGFPIAPSDIDLLEYQTMGHIQIKYQVGVHRSKLPEYLPLVPNPMFKYTITQNLIPFKLFLFEDEPAPCFNDISIYPSHFMDIPTASQIDIESNSEISCQQCGAKLELNQPYYSFISEEKPHRYALICFKCKNDCSSYHDANDRPLEYWLLSRTTGWTLSY